LKDFKKFRMKEACIELINLCPFQTSNQKRKEVEKGLEK